MSRHRWIAALTVAVAISPPADAHAGTYEVVSCAASQSANRAWIPFNDDAAGLVVEDSCATVSGGTADGLSSRDRIPAPPNALAGREAGWRISAPPGTTISRLTAQYYLGQFSAGEWLPFIRTSEGVVLESCVPPTGQTRCQRGESTYSPFGPAAAYAVQTASIDAGVRCMAPSGTCGNGVMLNAAWVSLYSTRVEISDPVLPALTSVTGPLWADGYRKGNQAINVAASDTTGIRTTWIAVDGIRRDSAGRACDYTRVTPCSDEPGARLDLDTRTLTDGTHQATVGADDAAGNTATAARSITVDNTAPSPPVGLQLDGAARRSTNRFDVRWQSPDGQIAPIAAARWSLCPVAGSAPCAEGARVQPSIDRLDGLEVPSSGDWDLRVWLEDAAANASSDRAAGPLRLSLARTSGRDPAVRIRGVSRRGRLIRVRGVAEPASGRVRVSVERRVGSRLLRVRGIAGIREGRWNRGLRLTSRMARLRRLSVVVRFEAQDGYRAVTARRRVPR